LADVLVAEGQAEETEKKGAMDSAAETICLVKRGFMVGLEFLTLYLHHIFHGKLGFCCHIDKFQMANRASIVSPFRNP
jgi:hypothetical protein